MKNPILLFALIAALLLGSLSLNSCSDDEPNYPDIKLIYGRWQVIEMRADGADQWNVWPYEITILTFNANGSLISQGYFGFGEGHWNSDKSIVTGLLNDGTNLRFRILGGVENKLLELKSTNIFGTIDIKLKALPYSD